MKLYDIQLCKKEDYEQLIEFISDYWNQNHIFIRSKEIFEFQHGNAHDGYYDFIIAKHRDDKPQAVYGALWKVRDDIHNKDKGKLGLGVLYYLLKLFPDSVYITLGLSPYSQDIYTLLHFDFGKMKHYYIVNDRLNTYQIISSPENGGEMCGNMETDNTRVRICELDHGDCMIQLHNVYFPQKDFAYIENRYLKHPVYHYCLWGIFQDEILECIWITRKVSVGNAACIRIVDMVGDLNRFGNIRAEVIKLLDEQNAEYIDCYNYGIPADIFMRTGFAQVSENDNVIVPNYFEPFEKRNVDIHYAVYGNNNIPVVIFKGDGDQDRPSII